MLDGMITVAGWLDKDIRIVVLAGYGKTPTQTFGDSKQMAKEKMLDSTLQTVS